MTELLTAPHTSVPTPGLWNTSPPTWKTIRRREPAKPRMHFCFTLYHNPVRSGIRGHGSTQKEFTCRGQAAPMLKFSTGILKLLLFILTALGLHGSVLASLVVAHWLNHGMWDLSSPTRDQTWAPCTGSLECYPLDHWEVPQHWNLHLSDSKADESLIQAT